ncbi:MAG: hypothetical protein ICV61_01535 [Microcoleus sp. Co-bin12]|nr:hypothetical protein [Microcoleus sp. Co-bin12]
MVQDVRRSHIWPLSPRCLPASPASLPLRAKSLSLASSPVTTPPRGIDRLQPLLRDNYT